MINFAGIPVLPDCVNTRNFSIAINSNGAQNNLLCVHKLLLSHGHLELTEFVTEESHLVSPYQNVDSFKITLFNKRGDIVVEEIIGVESNPVKFYGDYDLDASIDNTGRLPVSSKFRFKILNRKVVK